jgi:putative transposase
MNSSRKVVDVFRGGQVSVATSTDDGISLLMQALVRRYVKYFNFAYQRSGTLWEGRYKSSAVDKENYLLSIY